MCRIRGGFYVRVTEKGYGLSEAVARGRRWPGATPRPDTEYDVSDGDCLQTESSVLTSESDQQCQSTDGEM